jgi:sucrose-6-phosphate hydrolase SacC (GH32 family)
MRITYDAVAQTLYCRETPRTRGGWALFHADTADVDAGGLAVPLVLEPGEDLTLRVFLDRSVVEVFANRRVCMTGRMYPEDAGAVEVALLAESGEATAKQLDAWQMKSIW